MTQIDHRFDSFFEKYHDPEALDRYTKLSIEVFQQKYHAVLSQFNLAIKLPAAYHIHDFTKGENPSPLPYSIGKFDENRSALYDQPLFQVGESRCWHVGIDMAGPVGTGIYAPWDGEVETQGYLKENGDYGHVLITRHQLVPDDDQSMLWILYGHLSADSICHRPQKRVIQGEIIAKIGNQHENGGWFPHLHIQFSRVPPRALDLPGVVSPRLRAQALSLYFNPYVFLY